MAARLRQPDEHPGPAGRLLTSLEDSCDVAVNPSRDEVLPRHRDRACVPGGTEPGQRRHQPVVDEVLERRRREDPVELGLQPHGVEVGRQGGQQVERPRCEQVGGVLPGQPVGAAGAHLLGGQSGRPASRDQRLHRREPAQRALVVHPVAGVAARGLDHPVAPLPHAQRVRRDAGQPSRMRHRVHDGILRQTWDKPWTERTFLGQTSRTTTPRRHAVCRCSQPPLLGVVDGSSPLDHPPGWCSRPLTPSLSRREGGRRRESPETRGGVCPGVRYDGPADRRAARGPARPDHR